MNEAINVVVEFILNMFELYIVYMFMRCFFDTILVNKYSLVIVYLLRYFFGLVIGSVANYPIINMIVSWLSLFLIACCYVASLSRKFIVSFLIWMCAFVAEAILALFIGFGNFNIFEESMTLNNFYSFILKIIFWGMTLVVRKFQNIKTDNKVPVQFSISVMLIIFISIFMETMVFQQREISATIATPFLTCIVLLNIIIIYQYDTLSKSFQEKIQLKLMEKEVESYHNQFEIVQKNYEEMKMFRHDYMNRLIGMQQMVNRQELQELESYLEDILGNLNSKKIYCDTGNMAIDSIVNYLLAKAEERGIRIQTEIKIPDKINIPGDDIVVLVGNLIDNAIEANLNSKIQEKKLFFQLRYDKKTLKICIKNSYAGNVKEKDGRLLTSKKDKSLHGFGMKSVDAIIEKYDGVKKIRYDEKEFVVTVMLYF